MAEEQELEVPSQQQLHLLSAFLSMESPTSLISLARVCGGGSITDTLQSFIWHHFFTNSDGKYHAPYLRSFLKKLIVEVESTGDVVLDELYEKYTSYVTSLKDYDLANGKSRVLKWVSFLFVDGSTEIPTCPNSRKLVIPLQCSLNMLEGDTGLALRRPLEKYPYEALDSKIQQDFLQEANKGYFSIPQLTPPAGDSNCSLWPSSLFLSEFILSCPELFSSKSCFEVGSGVGLVGICLAHVKASKVILSDGDLSTLANMKVNLELNQLSSTTDSIERTTQDLNLVECVYLPWESAQESELKDFMPDIVLGADVIYDPSCLPHLIRVLAALLNSEKSYSHDHNMKTKKQPVAYIASVVRSIDTFNCFLTLADEANLRVTDITDNIKPFDLLPYMLSYQRSNVRLLTISYNFR